ncbi:hypothetical protein J2X69_000561 [Algoriphagus sp. 4150]|nr:hypothetical protein [Algoriphagus sp. 4150]
MRLILLCLKISKYEKQKIHSCSYTEKTKINFLLEFQGIVILKNIPFHYNFLRRLCVINKIRLDFDAILLKDLVLLTC